MSTALTLYNVEENLLALLDTEELIETEEGQLAILDAITEANEQAVKKRRNVRAFLLWLQAQQENCKTERDRIAKLEKHYASTEERVSKYVVQIIDRFAPLPKKGAKKLECEPGTLSLAKNPDTVVITDEVTVPAKFKTVTITMPAKLWEEHLETFMDDVGEPYMDGFLRAYPEYRAVFDSIKQKLDLCAIKNTLKSGDDVPGADLKFGENRLVVR